MLFQEQLYAGNRESFRKAFFSRDSILLWVWQAYGRRRREYPALFERLPCSRRAGGGPIQGNYLY